MENITAKLGNCSKYTNFILCSLYVPRCDEKVDKPLLPCRDVCEKFLSDCWDKMNAVGLNWLKALCGLLRTMETDPKCFKPTGFKPITHVPRFCNQTISIGNCHKALQDSSTFIPTSVQKEFQQHESATLKKLESVKNPQCSEILKQLACSLFTPPCKGNKRMTLCLSQCDRLRVDCPDALKLPEVSSYCAEPAEGNSNNGLCELTRWPSARHWDEDKKSKRLLPKPFPGGLIAVLILVPLMAVIFIYVAVAVRRRYEQKKSGYLQQPSTYTESEPVDKHLGI